MTESAATEERQTQWQERLSKQANSGLSVAAFCKSEGISVPNFYWWRAKLRKQGNREAEPFIDLGRLESQSKAEGEAPVHFDIRLELPGGMLLTIASARH